MKKNFLQESGIQFSELEEKVLQFHLSNLEYACGSTLDQVWLYIFHFNEENSCWFPATVFQKITRLHVCEVELLPRLVCVLHISILCL